MQLRSDMLIGQAVPILLAVLALHVGRAVAVYGCFAGLRLTGRPAVPWRWQHVMVFGNVKGALSMAAVLALPAGIPYRDPLIAIVFGVTLVTLVTQALPFRRFLIWLRVASHGAGEAVDQSKAVLIGARRAQMEIDSLLASGLLSRREHAERWAAFQRDIIRAERVLRREQQDDAREDVALYSVLSARKAAVLDAARRGLITEGTAAAHVAGLDAQLVRALAREEEEQEQA
jgi:CPA1 family monovalent cation:H+ antiporter